jgi:hypothetical protein
MKMTENVKKKSVLTHAKEKKTERKKKIPYSQHYPLHGT